MSVADDLREREKQAGNAEDSYDPGRQHYDEQFNKIANEDEDEDFDQIIANNYGDGARGEKIDAHGDKVQRNYNADTQLQDKEENPAPIPRNDEDTQTSRSESGGRWSKLLAGSKKYGPTGGVIGLILALFGGGSIILAPGALLVNIEKALTNDGSDATRTNIMMRRAYIGGLFSKKQCTSKACERITMMSEEQKKRWERLGFKIDGQQTNGRYRVTSIETPDKKTLRSAAEFNNYAENTVEGRKHANRVLNVRAAYFQNEKFNKVLDKFKLVKSDRLKTSTDRDKEARKEAIDSSFDEKAESSKDRDTRLRSVRSAMDSGKSKVTKKGVGNKLTNITNVADFGSTVCMAYNITRVTVATVKAKWIYDLVKFAFPFVQAAAQIEDQGDIEPEVVENLSDRLTWYDNRKTVDGQDNPKFNLTAMDSEGLVAAIYGDFGKLDEITKQYTTPALAAAIQATNLTHFLEGLVGGKENLQIACQAANAGSLIGSAQCIAGPLAVAMCAGGALGMLLFGDDIVDMIVNAMAEPAMDFIANANLSSDLKGVDAGNALAAGIGLMLTSSSMGYGLKPAASLASVNSFIAATDEMNYKYTTQLALDEAKENPFDMTNQYSFAGQIASAFHPYRSADGTAFSQILNGLAVVASPLTKLSTASALYSQPSNMTLNGDSAAKRINCADGCDNTNVDKEMEAIGAVNDWSGRMVGVTSGAVLGLAIGQAEDRNDMIVDNIDYMIANKYIDENGKPIDDSEYGKYKEYCTEERVDPLGTTSKSVEDGDEDDQKWFTGEKCLGKEQKDQEMLDNFAIYINICESQVATAESAPNCWEDTVKPAGNVTPNTGDWVIPTSGPCLSPYGMRWGKLHAGIDISPPSGTPIVAPTSMTITFAGMNDGGYGYMVTGKATDGTEYSFRFGHMIAQPPVSVGQEVSKGTEIGKVGSTGNVTGPHLHFEIFPPGGNPATYAGAIDPVPVLGQNGVTISCG